MKYLQHLKKVGKNYFALCPFHSETNPSFSINPHTGWFFCFGCNAKGNIFQFLLKMKEQGVEIDEEDKRLIQRKPETQKELQNKAKHNIELGKNYKKTCQKTYEQKKSELLKDGYSFVSEYIYYSLNGVEEYRVYRFERPKGDGEFEKQIFPVVGNMVGMQGKKQILYGMHQFMFASPESEIWLCEGEKCADAIIAAMPSNADLIVLGYRKPSDFQNIPIENLFQGKEIVIFEDNDEIGSKKTKEIVEILKPFAKTIKLVTFSEYPEKFDIADFLEEKDWNALANKIDISETIETPASQVNIIKNGTAVTIQKQEEWILEPLLPSNSIILLDGLGGLGKSIFAMEMAYAISTGQSFLLQDILPMGKYPILYLTAEESDWRFFERLKNIENAYQCQSKNFYWVSTISKDFCLSTARFFCKKQNEVQPTETFAFLENAIQKTNAKLVVLDSWVNFYGLDENSTEDGIYAYDCLKGLIRKYDCSFILIHHQTKDAMKSLSPLFRGTMVFREQARARIVMSSWSVPDKKKVSIEKSNYYSSILTHFPILISMSKGVWTIEAMSGEFLDLEEEEEEIENKSKKKKNKNGSGKCINTIGGDDKWLQMPDDF
jgi:KaiC/GvpD/RAD55 family RecA-like ATPase